MKALSLFLSAVLLSSLISSLAVSTAQAQARMDEAERLSCESTIDGVKVELNLYETTGDKGEPYGTGRYEQKIMGQSIDGDMVVETNGNLRRFTLAVVNEPAKKFAQFEAPRKFHGDIEIRALNMQNRVWGKFHCVGHN